MNDLTRWMEVPYTLPVPVVVPVQRVGYGWANLLWFFHIALLTTIPALWRESRLPARTVVVAVLFPVPVWNLAASEGGAPGRG